jgi:hypothetical protein
VTELERWILEKFRNHWGRAYEVSLEDGLWKADPRDGRPALTALLDDELWLKMRADYCAQVDAQRTAAAGCGQDAAQPDDPG